MHSSQVPSPSQSLAAPQNGYLYQVHHMEIFSISTTVWSLPEFLSVCGQNHSPSTPRGGGTLVGHRWSDKQFSRFDDDEDDDIRPRQILSAIVRGMPGTCNTGLYGDQLLYGGTALTNMGGGSAVLQLLIINIAKFDPVFFSKKTMGQSPCFCRVFCSHWVLSSLLHRIQTGFLSPPLRFFIVMLVFGGLGF